MKKKIALVINKLSDGGAERVVSNLSLGLYDKFDIDIIVNDSEHLEYPYKGHIISLNLPSEPKCLRTLYQIQVVNRRIRVLRYLKKKKKYAAVISFSDMCNVSNVSSSNQIKENSHDKLLSFEQIRLCWGDDYLMITPCLWSALYLLRKRLRS